MSPNLPKRIFLIGYRATGKSTVGQLLAQALGWAFADTDQRIVNQDGREIADIFAADGEAYFRQLESAVLQASAKLDQTVIATGGGSILLAGNRHLLREAGCIVWLDADVATIQSRLAGDPQSPGQRPSLTGQGVTAEVESVLQQRRPLYAETADIIISTDGKSPSDLVDEIRRRLP